MVAESQWLTPSIIVPAISVLVASVVVPLLLHWLRGRREEAARIFDIRKEIYTQYFRKYEQAAEGVGNDYEQFSQVTLKNEFHKLLAAGSTPDAIVAFSSAVSEFPHKIQSAHRKATEEITTIKVLGSEDLLRLTTEFERINQEILEMAGPWLAEMQATLTMPNFESPVAVALKKKGQQAKELKEKIILQMRSELGFGK